MLRVLFDAWPLLVTEVSGHIGLEDIEFACAAYEHAFLRGGHFVSLVDLSQVAEVPPGEVRHAYARWRAAHLAELQQHVIGVAHVVGERRLIRAAMAALSWVVRHPRPELYFKTYDEALKWARKQLPPAEQHVAASRSA